MPKKVNLEKVPDGGRAAPYLDDISFVPYLQGVRGDQKQHVWYPREDGGLPGKAPTHMI